MTYLRKPVATLLVVALSFGLFIKPVEAVYTSEARIQTMTLYGLEIVRVRFAASGYDGKVSDMHWGGTKWYFPASLWGFSERKANTPRGQTANGTVKVTVLGYKDIALVNHVMNYSILIRK